MAYRFQRVIRIICSGFQWLSMVVAWIMTCIVFFDAVSHKLFQYSLQGSYDLVSYLFIGAISFALSSSFIDGKIVKFELLLMKSPKDIQEIFNSIVALIGAVLSILIIWQSLLFGYSLQAAGEVSPTAKFPIYPFAYGIAISFCPVFLTFVSQFINSIKSISSKIPAGGV